MAVILAGLWLITAEAVVAQYSQRTAAPKQSKGPRALGLLELMPDGKARLVPVAILYNGEFYDASAYKASPVPMALESGIVYEGEKTGASLGLFTVTGALQTKDSWLGVGNWQPAGSVKAKKAVVASKPPDEDTDAPPVLRRSGNPPPKAPEPAPQAKPETPATAAPAATPAPEPTPPPDEDHPTLKRGSQVPFEPKNDKPQATAKVPPGKGSPPAPGKPTTMQVIPAISDAHGPQPQPFKYELKPEEESIFRQKMLAIASEQVLARVKASAGQTNPPVASATKSRRTKSAAKPPQPAFDDVDLRIFDLTNANEPVLVLTATAHMPETANTDSNGLQYFVTLVARNDIYGDLHKAFVNISDTQHLDILPRMELIDAVDADGDGRGELLFRQTSDAGKAFVIYRVIGDSLYALYQGTPSGG